VLEDGSALEDGSVLRVPSALRERSALEDGSALALRVASALDEWEGETRSEDLIAVFSPPPTMLCGKLCAVFRVCVKLIIVREVVCQTIFVLMCTHQKKPS
jgi:hypothetical protein